MFADPQSNTRAYARGLYSEQIAWTDILNFLLEILPTYEEVAVISHNWPLNMYFVIGLCGKIIVTEKLNSIKNATENYLNKNSLWVFFLKHYYKNVKISYIIRKS